MSFLPRIETLFEEEKGTIYDRYRDLIPLAIEKVIPADIFVDLNGEPYSPSNIESHIQAITPLLKMSPIKRPPFNLSFFLICRYRPNAYKFFFEMITRWLVPGKRLNVLLIYAVDFRMPEIGETIYTLCEAMIRIEADEDVEELKKNLPLIETEMKLGINSSYYARKILEIKGLKSDEKTAVVQDYITYLLKHVPKAFDIDIFAEMQHVMIKCRDDFKAIRESKHLGRIISIKYLFRKSLFNAVENFPKKRHLRLKLVKTRLHLTTGIKIVLGIIVGVNFLKNNEVFDEAHILKTVQQYIPEAMPVPGAFFEIMRSSENISTLYMELEKNDGSPFTNSEIRRLRQELPTDLKNHIEHLIHPIFMPCNEEEIIRNILNLSTQLKYVRDIPQVVLNFDQQTEQHLIFTVIILRVLKESNSSIQKLFQTQETPLEYVHDRVKIVGHIRNKYPKEATVCKVKLPKKNYLRNNHSIDLYRARRAVVEELSKLIGDIRDFNGGMISKQNELLTKVRHMLAMDEKKNELLLENLFYSTTPVVMRSVLDPHLLKTLFLMLLEVIDEAGPILQQPLFKIKQEGDNLLIMIASEEAFIKEQIGKAIASLVLASANFASTSVTVNDILCLGYIYRCPDSTKRQAFLQGIEQILLNTLPILHPH